MEQDNYENLLNICSKDLISNEGEIISRLCLDVRNSAISLSIIPFSSNERRLAVNTFWLTPLSDFF